jgi:glucose-6-phosphate dehydrogenase assembly protein OpcA
MITSTPPLGARTHIDVRAIERELNQLWKQIAEGEQGEKRHDVTRTCVLNLIVITGGGREAERATAMVAKLTARNPNRAIVVSAAPHARKDVLDAWVQMHCLLPAPGRPQVCGEQISIEARGPAVDRVPGTIVPLLVPDVPVVLWWLRGEPFGDPRLARFADLVDRTIVDSATFAAPEAGMARMARWLGSEARVSDLAWGRLTPWRELTAQFFDAPAMAQHLGEVVRVTVDYEMRRGGAPDRSQALLLIGWLVSRLGWRLSEGLRPTDGGAFVRLLAGDGGPIEVELRQAEPQDDVLDRLAALTIECRHARFTVARDDEPDCAMARAEVGGMQPLARRVRLERLDEADLLGEEVRLLGRDQTFEEALRFVAEVVGSQ